MTVAVILAFLKKFWIPILITILVIGIGLYARSCYVDYKQRQVQEALNVERKKVIDAYVAEAVADVEGKRGDATNQAVIVEEATKKLEEAKKTDSNKSTSDAAVVRQKFCSLYPQDSLCQ
jgi:hypothetical protein